LKLRIVDLSKRPKLRAMLARAVEKKQSTKAPLTRKDLLIAGVLRRQSRRHRAHLLSHPNDGVVFAAHAIADALKRDNPKFDRQRFILAFRGKA
jgi:hypothetical protein